MIGKKINQLATELAPASTDLTIIGNPTTGVSKKITLAQLGAIFSGAVSFYTNLASFPATGTLDVIFCAKDTQKLYLWSGSAYVEVFPSQALLDTYQLRSEKGVSNGYASLDSSGKVPISQLPSSIMEYKGTWNAATNTPTLANGTGDTGDVYICNVAGTVDFGAGPITFAVGDYVIYSGTIWQRSSGAVGTVTSVAASITGNSIGITGSPVTTSGTLAFAFAGTGTQYIKGDGTLATFPSTIAQAERLITEVYNSTGATLTKGTIVYINGGQGNLPTVTKALATGDSTSAQTFGVVQADITNNNNGYVVVAGKLSDLDTQAYTEGTQLYLSSTTAGTWTSTKQYAPAHLVYVGIVVRSHPTQGIVEIKIQNGYELDEIHNVAAQTPTNNDGLFWESATSLWKNKSIATVLGYTPQPQLSGTGFVKISGTTISYDNSTYLTTSAASSTYLPLVLNGSANTVDINGQQFTIQGSAGGYTSGRIIVDPVFSAIGYQVSGVFNGLKILTNGNADFTNSGVTRFFNQVRFDSTLTDGTYTYTLPGATGTIALVGGAGVGTVTSVGLSSATSGVTIGSTPITTSGTITLAIATASGSQQGLLSSTDWTTFNNKQNALTNPVTGTGTTNYLPKFTGTSTIGNSAVSDDGSTVALNSRGLNVSGASTLTGRVTSVEVGVTKDGADTIGDGPWFRWTNAAANRQMITQLNASNGLTTWAFNGTSWSSLLTLTQSGNLGLGVTPSAWGSNRSAIQFGALGAVFSDNNVTSEIGANVYISTAPAYTYITSNFATRFAQINGQFQWHQAPSGTAGNAISFTQAMTLNASGNLSIGNTNDTYKLDVSGTGRFTSNLYTSTALYINTTAAYGFRINSEGDNGFYNRGGSTASHYPFLLENSSGSLLFQIQGNGVATFGSSGGSGLRVYGGSGTNQWDVYLNSTNLRFSDNTGTGSVVFDRPISGTSATFSSSVTAGGNITGNGVTIGGSDVRSSSNILTLGGTSELIRIVGSTGNVGIGTTSPVAPLHVFGNLSSNPVTFEGNSSSNAWVKWKAGATSASWQLGASSGAFIFYDDLQASERLRITSGGNVLVGTTSLPSASVSGFCITGTSSGNISSSGASTSAYNHLLFYNGNGLVGYISTSGSTTTYSTSSDYRLKTDFKDFSGLDLVSKIKAYDYEWKSDKSRSYGVIAHELQSVINYAVTGVKDGEQMQGVDYSKIVPVLIKAIQEQQQQIEQLKNK